MKGFFKRDRFGTGEIEPDQIFLDSTNLPAFNKEQFEGRIEQPVPKITLRLLLSLFLLLCLVFVVRVYYLQIVKGDEYFTRSEQNHLRYAAIFPNRGIITDRTGVTLSENVVSSTTEFALRQYIDAPGFGHLLGYVKYPSKDSAGYYYKVETEGVEGAEKRFNASLAGQNGLRIIEVNAKGAIESRSMVALAQNGAELTLSIDARLQKQLYTFIKNTAETVGFDAGASILMDVTNGELIAFTSYPEYSSQVLTDGDDDKAIQKYVNDAGKPFLNRAIAGLYTPGSIVKPFIAMGALNEGVIDEHTQILSTGSISIPNPFDPTKKTVFNDWRAHGWVDMRKAIAVSSDVYFYEIGGGFEDQLGLGIAKVEKYLRMFGFGSSISEPWFGGKEGTIPNPAWKAEHFDGEPWRIGDTYNTSIGQYGVQVTPMQVIRAVGALANYGTLFTPQLTKGGKAESSTVDLPEHYFTVAHEGMRQAVLEGTAAGLNIPQVAIAAKTGTAELGAAKKYVNSWIIGFYPYEHPRYAFATVMEKGPHDNTIGALYVMRQFFEWMSVTTPEYIEPKE